MNQQRWTVYQVPASPLARLGMALIAVAVVALSFVLGLFVLAIALGLAVIGAITLAVRRLLSGRSANVDQTGPIDVEYRVVHRERRSSTDD